MPSPELSALEPAAAPSSSPHPRRWALLAAALAALALVLGGLSFSFGLVGSPAPVELRGVRLGLSAGDARERFVAPQAGSWTSESSPEPVLRWSPEGQGGPVRSATFEFHQGMLVAIRLRVTPEAPEARGPSLELSRAGVLSRSSEPDGTTAVSMLSRDCPTHADEVKRLLSGQR